MPARGRKEFPFELSEIASIEFRPTRNKLNLETCGETGMLSKSRSQGGVESHRIRLGTKNELKNSLLANYQRQPDDTKNQADDVA